MVINNLIPKVSKSTIGISLSKSKGKVAEIVKLSSPISTCLPKKILNKSKFFRKGNKSMKIVNTNIRKSYT